MNFKKVLDAMPQQMIASMAQQANDARGNFGHKGRPGMRGGSAPRGGSSASSQPKVSAESDNVSSFVNAESLHSENISANEYMNRRSVVNLKKAMTSDSPKSMQSLKYEVENLPNGSVIEQYRNDGYRTYTRRGNDYIIKTGSGDDGHIVKPSLVAELLKATGDSVKSGERVYLDITRKPDYDDRRSRFGAR